VAYKNKLGRQKHQLVLGEAAFCFLY